MIILSVLLDIILAIMIIVGVIALICGAGFIFVFGEIFIAALIINLIIKLFKKRRIES